MADRMIRVGDRVRCHGLTVEIGRIFYQDWNGEKGEYGPNEWGWSCEFLDTNGGYHYWKQYLDGGELIQD